MVYESEVDDWKIPTYDQVYEPESEPSSDEDDDESQDDDDDQSENDENLDETRSSFASDGGSLRRKRKRRRTSDGSSSGGQRRRRRRPIADIIARRELKRQKKLAWKKQQATVVWEYKIKSWHGASVTHKLKLEFLNFYANAFVFWSCYVPSTVHKLAGQKPPTSCRVNKPLKQQT